MEDEVKNGDALLAAKSKELKEAEAEVSRLEASLKEYTKSWDKLLAGSVVRRLSQPTPPHQRTIKR